MKILILGGDGQLGSAFKKIFSDLQDTFIFLSKTQVNIEDFSEAKTLIIDISPDVIINCAAYTAVDLAETEVMSANSINNLAMKNISNICYENSISLVHFSTDYVFDGDSDRPYKEEDETNPKCIYGKTKLAGEEQIELSNCHYIIIRTSWIFSEYGKNFLKTIFKLGKNNETLNIINDQFGCPTYANDIANAVKKIIYSDKFKMVSGIYHFAGETSCSWFDFANYIFSEARKLGEKTPSKIVPVQTGFFPIVADRPYLSALDCEKITKDFDIEASDWKQGVINSLKILIERDQESI